MKMTPADYAALETMIRGKYSPESIEESRKEYAGWGLTPRRFRFDVLFSIPYPARQSWFDRGIYTYLNDDHIDTALKKILARLLTEASPTTP